MWVYLTALWLQSLFFCFLLTMFDYANVLWESCLTLARLLGCDSLQTPRVGIKKRSRNWPIGKKQENTVVLLPSLFFFVLFFTFFLNWLTWLQSVWINFDISGQCHGGQGRDGVFSERSTRWLICVSGVELGLYHSVEWMSLKICFSRFLLFGFTACRVMTFIAASHGYNVITPNVVHRWDDLVLMCKWKCFRIMINLFCRDFFFFFSDLETATPHARIWLFFGHFLLFANHSKYRKLFVLMCTLSKPLSQSILSMSLTINIFPVESFLSFHCRWVPICIHCINTALQRMLIVTD